MRNKLLKIVAVLALIAGMTGIAAAGNCVNANGALSSSTETNKVAPYVTGSGDIRDFYLTTTFNPGDIIGYCIYNTNPPNGLPSVSSSSANVNHWPFSSNTPDYIGFLPQPQGRNPLASPQTALKMGSVTFSNTPPDLLIILHVRSAELCGGYESNGEAKTCHVRQGAGNSIPEFPTIALPVAAALGIMFLMVRAKKKANP